MSSTAYRQQLEQRRSDLKRKLAARRGKPEYRMNNLRIEEEIERLDRMISTYDDPGVIAQG